MFSDQFQGISAAPVARWKEELSPQDAAVIEVHGGIADGPVSTTPGDVRRLRRWPPVARSLVWPLAPPVEACLLTAPMTTQLEFTQMNLHSRSTKFD